MLALMAIENSKNIDFRFEKLAFSICCRSYSKQQKKQIRNCRFCKCYNCLYNLFRFWNRDCRILMMHLLSHNSQKFESDIHSKNSEQLAHWNSASEIQKSPNRKSPSKVAVFSTSFCKIMKFKLLKRKGAIILFWHW